MARPDWARAAGSLFMILVLLGLFGSLLSTVEEPHLRGRRSLRETARRYLFDDNLFVLNSTYNVDSTEVTVVGTATGPNASVTQYWHTRGRQILDFYGNEVRLSSNAAP